MRQYIVENIFLKLSIMKMTKYRMNKEQGPTI